MTCDDSHRLLSQVHYVVAGRLSITDRAGMLTLTRSRKCDVAFQAITSSREQLSPRSRGKLHD